MSSSLQIDYERLPGILREIRTKIYGLTQEQLSKKIGISRQTYVKLEGGEKTDISFELLIAFSSVHPDYFIPSYVFCKPFSERRINTTSIQLLAAMQRVAAEGNPEIVERSALSGLMSLEYVSAPCQQQYKSILKASPTGLMFNVQAIIENSRRAHS
ncbi:helix-turn-helix transcriptional regulator [Microbulbifer sp. ZKSA002]|uniref:helix-turn-helix transcriptional regulator n=1 Tax=Microbulbifer sp. ZKSA002 TaxID=3243388 RepID=UPI0040398DD9